VFPEHFRAVEGVLERFQNGTGHLSGFYKSFLGGEQVQRFEEEFARYIGTKYAISTTSGTSALHVAIDAAFGGRTPTKLPQTVLTTPYTFAASASAILMSQNHPVFGDIQPDTLNLDPLACRESIAYAQPKAIVAVHLLGQPMNIESLRNKFPRAVIIEDCAQALGATVRGLKVGRLGEMGCFSFQETKSLTTLGEGGMITTNNEMLAELCRNIRNHGEKYGKKPYLGYNYRMTEAAAAYGRAELALIGKRLKEQIECALIVRKRLPDFLTPLHSPAKTKPVFFIVGTSTTRGFKRAEWVKKAHEKLFGTAPPAPGRTIGLGYTELIPDLPLYRDTVYKPNIPVAREMIQRAVWLDIHRFTNIRTVKERMDLLNEVKT
jgi:perosamine synthetase